MRCCLMWGSAGAFDVSDALSAIPSPVKAQDFGRELRRITPAGARQSLDLAPAGQTGTTVARSQPDNRPSFPVGDILRDSAGISIKGGNGPRDVGISIRGSNARNGFGIRNNSRLAVGNNRGPPQIILSSADHSLFITCCTPILAE